MNNNEILLSRITEMIRSFKEIYTEDFNYKINKEEISIFIDDIKILKIHTKVMKVELYYNKYKTLYNLIISLLNDDIVYYEKRHIEFLNIDDYRIFVLDLDRFKKSEYTKLDLPSEKGKNFMEFEKYIFKYSNNINYNGRIYHINTPIDCDKVIEIICNNINGKNIINDLKYELNDNSDSNELNFKYYNIYHLKDNCKNNVITIKNKICELLVDYNKKEVYLINLYDFKFKSDIFKDMKIIENILYNIEIDYGRERELKIYENQ